MNYYSFFYITNLWIYLWITFFPFHSISGELIVSPDSFNANKKIHQEASLKQNAYFPSNKKIFNSLGMEFVYISPGSFIMGSPEYEDGRDSDENLHEVSLTKGFYMQITEVTQGQWKELMGTNPWQGDKYTREGKNYPASCVSWYDTQKFIQKLNHREEKDIYRLPTEAEWEYVCRAGSQSIFCYGDNEETLSAYAWYSKNAYDIGEQYAHLVAQKQSNAWGLYDMYGNVWEWCQDLYGNYPSFPVTDPIGPLNGIKRVNRGGSWVYYARRCRSAARGLNDPSVKHDNLGFRLIMNRIVVR